LIPSLDWVMAGIVRFKKHWPSKIALARSFPFHMEWPETQRSRSGVKEPLPPNWIARCEMLAPTLGGCASEKVEVGALPSITRDDLPLWISW